MMKLSKRESILLSILVATFILFIYLKFLIFPQRLHIEALQLQKTERAEEYSSMQTLLLSEASYDKEILALKEEYNNRINEFFPLLNQEDIIIILNEMLIDNSIKATKMNFTEAKEELISNNDHANSSGEAEAENKNIINVMSINFHYSSDYEALMGFFVNLRDYHKKIIVDSFTINQTDDGKLMGDIRLDFYWLPHLEKEPIDTIIYSFENNSKKANPFAFYVGYRKDAEDPTREETFIDSDVLNENPSDMEHIEYLVQKDDTLYSISLHFYNNLKGAEDIILYNNIKDRNYIEEGEILFIPLK